jgi:hypothetical protein
MIFCFGTFASVLNQCKPSNNNPTQKELINSLLSSVYKAYISAEISDGDSTHLLNCEQNIKPDVRKEARKALSNSTQLNEMFQNFKRIVVNGKLIKTDSKTQSTIRLALLYIIENDLTIADEHIELMTEKTKRTLLEQGNRGDFYEFLFGLFLYTLVGTDNKVNFSAKPEDDVAGVKKIDLTFMSNMSNPDRLSPMSSNEPYSGLVGNSDVDTMCNDIDTLNKKMIDEESKDRLSELYRSKYELYDSLNGNGNKLFAALCNKAMITAKSAD